MSRENFIAYLDSKILDVKEEEKALIASDRKDEANFCKIKANVYDICKTLYNVSVKQCDAEHVNEDYLKRVNHLLDVWKEAYEKVKAHNVAEKIVVEEVKISTIEEVLHVFLLNQ